MNLLRLFFILFFIISGVAHAATSTPPQKILFATNRTASDIKKLRSLNPLSRSYLDLADIKFAIAYAKYHDLFDSNIKFNGFLTTDDRILIDQLLSRDNDLKDAYSAFQGQYPNLESGSTRIPLDAKTPLPDPGALGIPKGGIFPVNMTDVSSSTQPPHGSPAPIAPEPPLVPIQPPKKSSFSFGLWQSDKDLTLADDIVAGKQPTPQNAKPAQFAFSDNFNAKQVNYVAKGVAIGQLAIPIASKDEEETKKDQPNPPYVPYIQFIPTIGFDRNYLHDEAGSTAAKTGEIDELDFKLGVQWQVDRIAQIESDNGNDPYDQLFRVSFHRSTDWEFKSNITGGEFDTQPSFDRYNNIYIRQFLQIRWIVSAHLEGGFVGNPGTYTNLEANTSFARAGGYGELDFYPAPATKGWENLNLAASYYYYQTIGSNIANAHAYDLNATYYFDAKQNYSITMDYTGGIQDLTLKPLHTLNIGLGLKY